MTLMENNLSDERESGYPEEFRNNLPDVLIKIKTGWQQITQFEWDDAIAGQIQQILYRLSSSSAFLGYTKISAAAREIDLAIKDIIGEGTNLKEKIPIINQLFDEMDDAINNDSPALVPPQIDELQIHSIKENRSNRLIYLLEDDIVQSQALASQIGYYGYVVRTFSKLPDIMSAFNIILPQAILMDIVLSENDPDGFQAVAEINKRVGSSIPVIFISANTNLENRLQAVRSGGEAYFSKPLDIGALVDTLDNLIVHEDTVPYRVLIVDDTLVQAKYFSMALKNKGMETMIVTDPLKIMEPLFDFNPELILLDMYMPDCTGMELAKVIRQMEKFISIPIVFLSAETDKDKQLEAMSLGGDDFLAKPIKPEHLITSVATRIERYRKLRSLMYHDGLTSLLNHTTTKEILVQEVFRAARQNSPLCFAMLDLDKFKQVNDTYGHATGDRVLKSISRLLKQRLRKSDFIGRFGGEEFAVILVNTSMPSALKLMDNLRSSFENIQHLSQDNLFSVTFSCGIACYPQFTSAIDLSEAADKALYSAKHQGRNRVVVAE